MIEWAILFLMFAFVAAIFGFGGITWTLSTIAQILFIALLVLFIASAVLGRRRVR